MRSGKWAEERRREWRRLILGGRFVGSMKGYLHMENKFENISKEPLISVIVPVYNVMNYLEDCVNSIRRQTYKNIEIILVNDGSTDDSKAVCQKLMLEENRIRYYEKENSGLSDTRNVGIDHANGEYIMFVDSDDLISKKTVKTLYELCSRYKCKVAVGDIVHFSDGEKPVYRDWTERYLMQQGEAICSLLYQKNISTSACGKLYSSEVVKKNKFVSGILYEDNLFLGEIFEGISYVGYCNYGGYGYRHRNNSITTKKFTIRDMDILFIGKKIIEKYEGKNAEITYAVHAYQVNNCLRIYLTASEEERYVNQISYCRKYIHDHSRELILHSKARSKLKIAVILVELHIPSKILKRIHKKINRWK